MGIPPPPDAPGLDLRVLRTETEIAAVRGAWADLATFADPGRMFATPEWHATWLRHVAKDARPAVVVVRAPGGNVIGLAPLCEWPYRDLGWKVPALRFSGIEVVSGDYMDFHAKPENRPQVVAAVLGQADAALARGRMVIFGEVVRDSPTDVMIREWAERHGYAIHFQEARRCPHFPLPETFEDYLKTRSAKVRAHIRRKMRRIAEEPGLQLLRMREPDELQKGLEELFRLHKARWETRGLPGTFVRPGFREFLRDFAAAPPPGVTPIVYMLAKEDRAHAALLIFHCGHMAMHYQGGWDPESPLVKLSPGLVLTSHAIADAIEARLKAFDFLRGDEAYKLDFTDTCRETHTMLVVGRGLRARGYLATVKLKERVKRMRKQPAAAAPPPEDA